VPEGLPIAEFGFPGPLRDKPVAAVLRGDKTASAGLLEEFRREGLPIVEAGTRELVVDPADMGSP
jgi:hypothetical protein